MNVSSTFRLLSFNPANKDPTVNKAIRDFPDDFIQFIASKKYHRQDDSLPLSILFREGGIASFVSTNLMEGPPLVVI